MASTNTRILFTQLKVLGAGDGRLEVSNNQLHALFQFACTSLSWCIEADLGISRLELPNPDYFEIGAGFYAQIHSP